MWCETKLTSSLLFMNIVIDKTLYTVFVNLSPNVIRVVRLGS